MAGFTFFALQRYENNLTFRHLFLRFARKRRIIAVKYCKNRQMRASPLPKSACVATLSWEGFLQNIPGKGCFVAPQNRELLREAQLRRVEEFLSLAVDEARKGGFTLEELTEMLNILYQGE